MLTDGRFDKLLESEKDIELLSVIERKSYEEVAKERILGRAQRQHLKRREATIMKRFSTTE